MRIREFQIHRYGPLSASARISLASFNLFWGENEDGKTLALEALVKMLFGKAAQRFDGFGRVEEDPEGFLVLEDSEGAEIKMGKKILPEILSLSPESCRNLFVIRNSDLAIDREGDLYADLTEKLTGLQKNRSQRMKASLRELAGLTPQLAFTDIKESGRLKTSLSKISRENLTLCKNYNIHFPITSSRRWCYCNIPLCII